MLDNIFDQKVNFEMNVQIFPSHIEDAEYVVLSSGLGGHAQFWQPQIQDLQTKFHVLTYDQEGCHENSTLLKPDYCIRDLGQQLLLILKQQHIQRFHFIGHALGGFIGTELAYLCQSTEYQMLSITILNGWDTLDAHTYKCFETRINLLTCTGTEAYVKAQALFLYPPAWISANIEIIQKQEQLQIQNFPPHENVLRRLSALMDFQLSEEIRAALQNIPMHLIANQDDFLVPYQRSQNLKRLFPHAQLTLLKQGAHAATVTETVLMNKEMLGFLTVQESLV